jgi:SAM-dependent methyltransferase
MKNVEHWKPTKFVLSRGRLRASRDPAVVSRGSRFVAQHMAGVYQRAIEGFAHGTLLDLGCGQVPFYGLYRDRVTESLCIDWPNSHHPVSHIDQAMDLNEPLALPSESIDTILLTEVLEHIARPEVLWGEMARVLRPGGTLILTVPFLYWVHEDPYDYFRYTEYRLRLFCQDHGFTVVELEPTGGAPEVLLDILAKHCGVSRVLSFCHGLFSRGVMALGPVRKLSRITGRKFPLGYCLVARREAPTSSQSTRAAQETAP